MKYSYLFFDADETLYDFKHSEKTAFFRAFEHFGIPCEEKWEKVYSAINQKYWTKFNKGKVKKDELMRGRFADLLKKMKVDLDPMELNQCYRSKLAEDATLLPDTYEVVNRLCKAYKLVMITNGFESQQQSRFMLSGISDCFVGCYTSDKMGVQKPEKEYFDKVMSLVGVEDKEKILIIGDSLTSDIKGGNNAGIDTCWFNPKSVRRQKGYEIKYEIKRLTELYEILEV